MQVFRSARRKRANHEDLLSGKGAMVVGGRWNSKANAVVYTASSRSLAVLEILVHLSPPLMLSDYVLVTLEFSDDVRINESSMAEIRRMRDSLVDEAGRRLSELEITRMLGDEWLAQTDSEVLRVPSFAVRGESNLLLHPRMAEKARVVDYTEEPFDRRLFQNLENIVVEMQDLQTRLGELVRDTENMVRRYTLL